MASSKNITTTGLSRQIHTLASYHPKEAEITKVTHGTVHDWNYRNVPSVHNTFYQAVDSLTGNGQYAYTGVDLGGYWPRRPTSDGGPWGMPGHQTGPRY